MVKDYSTAPKFEEVYRQHEFSPLVGITLLLADGISRFVRKGNTAAPDRLSREQDTLHRHVSQVGTIAPRPALAADDWPNGTDPVPLRSAHER